MVEKARKNIYSVTDLNRATVTARSPMVLAAAFHCACREVSARLTSHCARVFNRVHPRRPWKSLESYKLFGNLTYPYTSKTEN